MHAVVGRKLRPLPDQLVVGLLSSAMQEPTLWGSAVIPRLALAAAEARQPAS
jgi:hypothetical protein